jgi:serine/threonine protein kinase
LFSKESVPFVLNLLVAAGAIAQIGSQRDRWLILKWISSASPTPNLSMINGISNDVLVCIRLYRVCSVDFSVASMKRRLFLQMAGLLDELVVASDRCKGILELNYEFFEVLVNIELVPVAVAVTVQTDKCGRVVHIVTTAIERALEEEILSYSRFMQRPDGVEFDLDETCSSVMVVESRNALNTALSVSLGSNIEYVPEIMFLSSCRIFWEELQSLKPIASGSYGEVFIAELENRNVAVKKLFRAGKNYQVDRETLREVRVLQELHHQNIVELIGVCLAPMAIVTELVEFGSLRAFLDERPLLPWHISHELLVDIASGMQYIHGLRPSLLHSDLKSPNILLGQKGNRLIAKICDLGLASFTSFTVATSVENPMWAAPELLRKGFRTCTPASDVYSFGIILWELCTSQWPFHDKFQDNDNPKNGRRTMMFDIADAVEGGSRPLLSVVPRCVPRPVVQLMQRCWASAPNDRPSFATVVGELVSALDFGEESSFTSELQEFICVSLPEPTNVVVVMVLLGRNIVSLCSDGRLRVFDSITLEFRQTLTWRLAENVRCASAVTVDNRDAYFVYGTDSMFHLSDALASQCRRSDLNTCDRVSAFGQCIWVAGRSQQGCSVQLWKEGAWLDVSVLVRPKSNVTIMRCIEDDMWIVDERGNEAGCAVSVICGEPSRGNKVLPKSTMNVSESVEDLCLINGFVWLFLSGRIMAVDRKLVTTLFVIDLSNVLLASLPLSSDGVIFGLTEEAAMVMNVVDKEAKIFSSTKVDQTLLKRLHGRIPLIYLSGCGIVIGAFGVSLKSWILRRSSLREGFVMPIESSKEE